MTALDASHPLRGVHGWGSCCERADQGVTLAARERLRVNCAAAEDQVREAARG